LPIMLSCSKAKETAKSVIRNALRWKEAFKISVHIERGRESEEFGSRRCFVLKVVRGGLEKCGPVGSTGYRRLRIERWVDGVF
jgi:hypothetical protein